MKRTGFCLTLILAVVCSAMISSCGREYKEQPFGGLNGRVQTVKVWHMMPEVWHANNRGTDVMYVNTTVYDIYGHEIYSAVMDSGLRVQAEAESLFENDVCVRSTQRSGGRVIARINKVPGGKRVLEYNKEVNGRMIRMSVKETSIGRRHKSVVTEDGVVTTISIIKTDREGYPVKISITEPQTGKKTLETNIFDENHNVIEKHTYTNMGENDEEENLITYTKYGDMDEHGNWINCRTFNKVHLPVEVLIREIEYWE